MSFMCPICGYYGPVEPPSAMGLPSYEICVCCGFQFGVTDLDRGFGVLAWRALWIAKGMQWRSSFSPPPVGWDPVKQLRRVSNEDV